MPHSAVSSKASISGHPLHPMLIPFPIAYLVGSLLTDLAYAGTGDPFWARASLWLVGAGLVMGVAAASLGLTDFLGVRKIREHGIAWAHFLGNATVLVLALLSFLIRLGDPQQALLPWGLILSLVITGLLIGTGWLGGELAYRHRIGVIAEERQARMEGERRRGPVDRRLHA